MYTQVNRGRRTQEKAKKPAAPNQQPRTDNTQVLWENISNNGFLGEANLDPFLTLSTIDSLEGTPIPQHYDQDEVQNMLLHHQNTKVSSMHLDELPSQQFGSDQETGVQTPSLSSEDFGALQRSSIVTARPSDGETVTPSSVLHSGPHDTLLTDFFNDDIHVEDDNRNNIASLSLPTPAFTATPILASPDVESFSSSSTLPKGHEVWSPIESRVHARQCNDSGRTVQPTINTVCNCSRSVMTLLEQVDQQGRDTRTRQPDTLVSLQAQTIKELTDLTECNKCVAQPEYRMLLFTVCRQLIHHMEQALNNLPSTSDSANISHGNNSLLWHVSIGSFHSQSRQEWTMIMCSLVIMHLKRVAKTLDGLRELYDTGSQTIESTVAAILKQKINRMVRTLHQQIGEN
ncbi:MAG: hypothetical protein GOMPHAMPRED_007288 [Gomphillus americanus]|uniref:Uncharacterized protein n=1 Tax=Gomphillus americanus TaxID=1940652 RepID=A0A8H3I178_9LECA|nr:MAG: hypothetical protein GOMPHAMPRED_007288 [Gomphillus americanus]